MKMIWVPPQGESTAGTFSRGPFGGLTISQWAKKAASTLGYDWALQRFVNTFVPQQIVVEFLAPYRGSVLEMLNIQKSARLSATPGLIRSMIAAGSPRR
jgi:hypothetical protein